MGPAALEALKTAATWGGSSLTRVFVFVHWVAGGEPFGLGEAIEE